MFASPSAEQHVVFAGLSGPRLAVAALLLAATVALAGLWMFSVINRPWTLHAGQVVDGWLCCPEALLATGFYNSLVTLALPVTALVGTRLHYGQVIRRAVEPIILLEYLSLLLLGFLVSRYQPVYCQPDFFADAPRKIVRSSFIGRLEFWLSAGILLIVVLVLIPSSNISMDRIPSHDSGIFLYFGQQILRGQIPFRDLWDHKPPMIFYMDALGLLLGRGSMWGVWILECLALAVISLLGFWTLRRYYRSFPAALAVCFSLGGIVFMLEGGNLTEELSMPLQLGALALFAISDRRGFTGWSGMLRAFTSGVLFSIALNFKQTMVGIWGALLLWLVLVLFFQRKWALWKVFAWVALGAVLAQAVFVLYYASKGTLYEYWRVAFVYNVVYSDISISKRINMLADLWAFLSQTTPIFPLAILAWIGGMVGTVRAILQRDLDILSFPLLTALIDFPLELVLISLSGKNYRHYFMTLIPGMMVLLAWGAFQTSNFFHWLMSSRRSLAWLIPVGTLLLVSIALAPSAASLLRMSKPSTEQTITDTVAMIRKETQSSDYVLMWGSQTVVNYLSGRQSPTRFVHQKALFRAGFANRSLSDEMLNNLQTHTPKLIINTQLASTPFITTGPDGSCQLPPRSPDGMEAVFQFICQNYKLDHIITKDNWEVYRLQK